MASRRSEYHYEFKIIIVGDYGVGKTSILLRLVHNKFYSDPYEFLESDYYGVSSIKVDINGQLVTLNIWDYREPRFDVSKSYY